MENEESEKHLEELRRRKFIDVMKLSLDEWLSLLSPESISSTASHTLREIRWIGRGKQRRV
jgi:hypothetical protein